MFRSLSRLYRSIPMVARILTAFALGTVLGLVCSFCGSDAVDKVVAFVQPFGGALISLLKMIVFPIVFFSLIVGASSLPLNKSSKLGVSVIGWYFLTSVFATIFGIALALLLDPNMNGADGISERFREGAQAFQTSGGSDGNLGTFFVGLFMNPFEALAKGQFLPIVVFSILAGVAIRSVLDSERDDEERKALVLLLAACKGCQTVSFKIVEWIVEYFPLGVFALAFTNFALSGVSLFLPYINILFCVVAGVLGMIFVVYPLALFIFCRENPYKIVAKLRLPILTAFTTRSSAATLSVSMQTANKLGVDGSLSSFSLPLGCTINMDGVCVHLPVFVVLASNLFGVHLSPTTLIALLVSVVFASVGAGGVPGGSVFLLFMILENAGFSSEQVMAIVGLALGVNPILDMFETACNVTGDNVCTYIIAKRGGLIHKSENE